MHNSRLYTVIRLLAGVLTLVALLAHYYLPKKTWRMVPNPETARGLSSDEQAGGPSRAEWIDQEALKSICRTREWDEGYANCSMSLSWGYEEARGVDLSAYDGFRIKLNYEGPARLLRIYMRNFNPEFSNLEDGNSMMFMDVWLLTRDFNDEIFIGLDEFTVADWWLKNYMLERHLQKPAFDRVVVLGIDFQDPGDHYVHLESVEFVGEWIATETLMLSIILLWMALVFWEGFSRLFVLARKQKQNSALINELVGNYSKLETEKKAIEDRARHDTLTGLLNRLGLQQALNKLFDHRQGSGTQESALILFDIDHFKRVNDLRGHDVGDAVLSQLARLLLKNLREGDVLGRWGGEEFILLCPNADLDKGVFIAEKLRDRIAKHRFTINGNQFLVTVSMGVAALTARRDFEQAFKRADKALYTAKNSGRNCVIAESER